MKLPILLYFLLRSRLDNRLIEDPKQEDFTGVSQIIESMRSQITNTQQQTNLLSNDSSLESQTQAKRIKVQVNNLSEIREEEKSSLNDKLEVKPKNYIEELDDFEDILHEINLRGEKEGVAFKKGTIQYWDDQGGVKYRSIICSCFSRRSKTLKVINTKNARGSLEEGKDDEDKACKAFYRLKYEKETGNILA